MTQPASLYLNITRAVERLIQDHAENDRGRIARLITRAAALQVGVLESKPSAVALCNQLADELDMSN